MPRVRAWVEVETPAVACYRRQSSDIARLLHERPTTAHRRLRRGLQLQQSAPASRARIDRLDTAISDVGASNATTR